MARPPCRDHNEGDIRPKDKSLFDITIDKITNRNSKDLIYGTLSGWIAGVSLVRVGKVAAFGLGGGIILLHCASESGYIQVNWERVREAAKRSQDWVDAIMIFVKKNSCYSVGFIARSAQVPVVPVDRLVEPQGILPNLPEPPETNVFEKAFLPIKPISHSPKISPSSIPNPSPSIATNKPIEPGYPNYSSYLYNIPGYSAFQPLSYPSMVPQNLSQQSLPPPSLPAQTLPAQNLPPNDPPSEFVPFPSIPRETLEKPETPKPAVKLPPSVDLSKQTDFEEHFTPEVIPATTVQESKVVESKMSITSLAQGSGATVTIPSQISTKDIKTKPPERFSLKTSIPISKIDMKCVNPPEPIVSNVAAKKPTPSPAPYNPTFQTTKHDPTSKVEIQSNIVIKNAVKEPEEPKQVVVSTPNSINTLINAAEAINKSDTQFRKPEPKTEVINEIKDPPPTFAPPTSVNRPVFNPINLETSKVNFPPKPTDTTNFNEQKNQIVFIQNKNQNPKMLLTIQQQNPQVLLQRTNFESKNVQVPSRLSSQSKKCKEDVIENSTSSKVVALKRLHQENCDENDFENLITENQIYGNKIVVKEKSQGTQQEQDLKNKKEKTTQETKNVVLQPNFLYLSNVQFPNLMMIKNNKVNQTADPKMKTPNENKVTTEASTMTTTTDLNPKNVKTQPVNVNKEIHVLKSSNNVLQTLSNKNNKSDLVLHTPHQKVLMNPQIVYQVPMIVDSDNKVNQPVTNRDYPKFIATNKKEYPNQFDPKPNDKLFIACPYQMDSKLQPKIVITNLRPKIPKVDEVSSLDIYEKRKRMRRLKYLSNRENKEASKVVETKKVVQNDVQTNLIPPEKMGEEICKEFATTRINVDEAGSGSDSEYGESDLKEYDSIIKTYNKNARKEDDSGKADFLAHFRLGTHNFCKEREMDRQERIIRRDSIAAAYVAAGRLDKLTHEDSIAPEPSVRREDTKKVQTKEIDNGVYTTLKHRFFMELQLVQVSQQFKEGYEKTWQEIIKERKRRNGFKVPQPPARKDADKNKIDIDHNNQLQILTEIKKSVNENNNLIKKRFDCTENENANDGDSIHILAEKNFSELSKLSKMADRSVKLITGQDARKRDLNPGFDSENIQKLPKVDQPVVNYPQINIPNISKIISLKSQNSVVSQGTTTQPTSMDEPVNSAAGVEAEGGGEERTKEAACQAEAEAWPGLEALVKSYKEFEAARKKEIAELHRRNTSLRVAGAHITRAASRDSDRARALLAERQHLVKEENDVRRSLHRMALAVDAVKNYKWS